MTDNAGNPIEQEVTEAPPAEEGVTGTPRIDEAPPVEPEEGTFESPTSNDVGEQTKTQADIAAEGDAEEGDAEEV